MSRIVISQSMLFPWVGLLEQIRLADIFVHYDDVQYSKGSFTNRVQVKVPAGRRWMTVPLADHHLGQAINEVRIKAPGEWRAGHLDLLRESFERAPFKEDAIGIVEQVYAGEYETIGDLARASLLSLVKYFKLDAATRFVDVQQLQVPGSGSERVLGVVKTLGGTHYVTGHGASRYLDHAAFEQENIHVEYVDYQCLPYPQLHGEFTPYVTALDLIANCGPAGGDYIRSTTVPWKEFVRGPQ